MKLIILGFWDEFAEVLHVLSLPWKLIFALVPPTEYCGGWPGTLEGPFGAFLGMGAACTDLETMALISWEKFSLTTINGLVGGS